MCQSMESVCTRMCLYDYERILRIHKIVVPDYRTVVMLLQRLSNVSAKHESLNCLMNLGIYLTRNV